MLINNPTAIIANTGQINAINKDGLTAEQAAKKFELNILEKRIETHKKNFTRFLILTKKDANKIQYTENLKDGSNLRFIVTDLQTLIASQLAKGMVS